MQVSLTLGCPMNLAMFPLDTQTCHLTIASYGWTAADLVYLWKVRILHEPQPNALLAVSSPSTARS